MDLQLHATWVFTLDTCICKCHADKMTTASALQLRQSLGRVIARLKRSGEPVLLTKDRKPVAVMISIADYEERFSEKAASDRRRQILAEVDAAVRNSVDKRDAATLLRELRGGI